MLYKSILFFFVIHVSLFGWGTDGHKLISQKSIEILPTEMNGFLKYKDYISEHAADADHRKDGDKSEPVKHYIDIDFYPEFLNGKMIYDRNELAKIYPDTTIEKMGTLPWATLETLQNLTKAFRDKHRDRVLVYAADLGHYVADGHQPMHTMLNYNGQLSGQKGIHFRYESIMVDKYISELDISYQNCDVRKIEQPLDFIFNYIADANSLSPVLYTADKEITVSFPEFKEEYYRLLWFRTNYVTKQQFRSAAQDLASLIYTAWVNAGKPDINQLD